MVESYSPNESAINHVESIVSSEPLHAGASAGVTNGTANRMRVGADASGSVAAGSEAGERVESTSKSRAEH